MTLIELRKVVTPLQGMLMQAVENNEHGKSGAIGEQINKVIGLFANRIKSSTFKHT